MSRDIYVRLDVVAHMIALRQIREGKHRDKHYSDDPKLKNTIHIEQSSALHWAFLNILEVAEMTHNIPEHEKKKLRDLTYSAEYAEKAITSYVLTKE
jgi:hypothetical protein